jgi:cell division protease FtsH
MRATPFLIAAGLAYLWKHRQTTSTREAVATPETSTEPPRRIPEPDFHRACGHESGHVLAAWIDPNHDVTELRVSPEEDATTRGRAGIRVPTLLTPETYRSRWLVIMAGRAAEKLLFDSPSAGARDDIDSATALALHYICDDGMSDRFGVCAYDLQLTTAAKTEAIHAEARRLVEDGERRAMQLLIEHRPALERLATAARTEHLLNRDRIKQLIEG